MILSYSNERFPALIAAGVKLHTIRRDAANRWKPGMRIDHWMHNPRHVSKHPYAFCKGAHTLVSKQRVFIFPKNGVVTVDHYHNMNCLTMVPAPRYLDKAAIETLAINDGFENTRGFFKWFETLEGQALWILHWTELKY